MKKFVILCVLCLSLFAADVFANSVDPYGSCNGLDNCNQTTTTTQTKIKDNQTIIFGTTDTPVVSPSSSGAKASSASGSGSGTAIDQFGVIMKGNNNKISIGSGSGDKAQTQSQSVNVNVAGDEYKRDLIDGPILSFPDAKLSNSKADTIKTKGSIFNKVKVLTAENVKMLLNGSTRVNVFMGPKATVEVRKLVDLPFITDTVAYGNKGKFLGSVYIRSEGTDLIALEALGARAAMDMGGTHLIASDTDSFISGVGDSKGFSIGASASGFVKGDDIAVAPGAMIGWSSVRSSNEALPTIIFDVYCDESILIKP